MFESVSTFAFILCLIALLLVGIFITLIWLLVYSGVLQSCDDVGTGKPPIGQAVIAYRYLQGPYNESGQTFTEAAIISPGNKALGIYYDNPEIVKSEHCRYVVGSILSEGSGKIDEDEVKKFTEKGFKIIHLPEVDYAVRTKFPHKTSLSILIAIFKAYPSLREYIEDRKLCAYPFIEYYDSDHIHFMAPLSKQDEFFVPECGRDDDFNGPTPDTDNTTFNDSHSTVGDKLADVTRTTVESDIPASSIDDSVLNATQNSSVMDEEVRSERSSQSEDRDSQIKTSQETHADCEPREDSEPVDDEPALSDASSSSFEVLKNDFNEL